MSSAAWKNVTAKALTIREVNKYISIVWIWPTVSMLLCSSNNRGMVEQTQVGMSSKYCDLKAYTRPLQTVCVPNMTHNNSTHSTCGVLCTVCIMYICCTGRVHFQCRMLCERVFRELWAKFRVKKTRKKILGAIWIRIYIYTYLRAALCSAKTAVPCS